MTNKEFAIIIVNLIKNKCTQPYGKGDFSYVKLNLDNEEVHQLFNEITNLAKDIEEINK